MAIKTKTLFRCQECGFASPKWLGQCPDCDGWNTFAEEARPKASEAPRRALTEFSSELVKLSEALPDAAARRPTGIGELDRLLGGGLVPGQVALLAGPPGIGKSTLMLQICERLAGNGGGPVLYVSGEESLGQVSARAKRLGASNDGIYFVSETNLARVLEAAQKVRPAVWVLDSIQTVYHPEWTGSPGTVGQVRECAAELLRAAKAASAALFLLGHVTKEGEVAGPRVLEHIVDTVLHFDAERHNLLRVLRAEKNRFGPTSEIALFEMTAGGLSEVADASAFFVRSDGAPLAGRAVSVAMEGTRPLLCEIQALVAPTRYPLPRRMVTGLDQNRTLLLLAALEKHLRLPLESRDVFVSLAGGLKLRDPALDLAVCAAVLSSLKEAPTPKDRVFVGEVGLLGDVGRVPMGLARLSEARRVGYKTAVIAARTTGKGESLDAAGLALSRLDRLQELTEALGEK